MCVSTYRKVVAATQGFALKIDSRYLSVSVRAEGDELFARNICIYIGLASLDVSTSVELCAETI